MSLVRTLRRALRRALRKVLRRAAQSGYQTTYTSTSSESDDTSVTINGQSYKGRHISIIDGAVQVDGVAVRCDDSQNEGVTIHLSGHIGTLSCDQSVVIHNGVVQQVDAKGSVTCDDITGDVAAGGSVLCDDVEGSIVAGGSVRCSKVMGSVAPHARSG